MQPHLGSSPGSTFTTDGFVARLRLEQLGEYSGEWNVIASVDGEDIAALELSGRKSDGELEIDAITVLPEFRLHGLGRAMLNYARAQFGVVHHAPESQRTPDGLAWSRSVGSKNAGSVSATYVSPSGQEQFADEMYDSLYTELSEEGLRSWEGWVSDASAWPRQYLTEAQQEPFASAFRANLRRVGFPNIVTLRRNNGLPNPLPDIINASISSDWGSNSETDMAGNPVRLVEFTAPLDDIIAFGWETEGEVFLRTRNIKIVKRAAMPVRGIPLDDLFAGTRPTLEIRAVCREAGSAKSGKPFIAFGGQVSFERKPASLRKEIDKLEAGAKAHLSAPGSAKVIDNYGGVDRIVLIGSGNSSSSVVLAEKSDWSAPWRAPKENVPGDYGDIEPMASFFNHLSYGTDEELMRVFLVDVAGGVYDDSQFDHLSEGQKVVVYRGISLPAGTDPTNSVKDGQGAGSSWTLDEQVAMAIAERGRAGFTGDNTRRNDVFWVDLSDKEMTVPTVLRAEVELSTSGAAPYRPWSNTYASEQEIDLPRGQAFTLTGWKQAKGKPVSSSEKSKAEKAFERSVQLGREEKYDDPAWMEGRNAGYYVHWEWGSWKKVNLKRAASVPSWRLISVVDTREFVEGENDKWYPVGGSGSLRACDRCGKQHEIHATMEDSAGKQWVVGVGCARNASPELDGQLKAGQSAATTIAKNEAEVAALRDRLAVEQRVRDEVQNLPAPRLVTVERNGQAWRQTEDGKSSALEALWMKANDERGMNAAVISSWREAIIRERLTGMGWKRWYPGLTSGRLEEAQKRLKRSQKKASSQTLDRAYRGVPVVLTHQTGVPILEALAKGQRTLAAHLLIDAMSNSTKRRWWAAGDQPEDEAGRWWTNGKDQARAYASGNDDGWLIIPVLMTAEFTNAGTEADIDGSGRAWWHLPAGKQLTITQFEACWPEEPQVLLDSWHGVTSPGNFDEPNVHWDGEWTVLPVPKMKTSAALWGRPVSAMAAGPIVHMGTPRLKYDYSGTVERIAILDPDAEPPKPGWTYFTTEPVEDYSSRAKRDAWDKGKGFGGKPRTKAKPKPKWSEGSGTADEGTVAFLDFIDNPWQSEIFIAFMSVRDDFRGQGYARQLVEWVYAEAARRGRSNVDWGTVFFPANRLYWKFYDGGGKVTTTGHPLDGRNAFARVAAPGGGAKGVL